MSRTRRTTAETWNHKMKSIKYHTYLNSNLEDT